MSQQEAAKARLELNTRLRALLLERLDLPQHVDFDQPLFGRGLELDSLDTLEIVSVLEEEFGIFISDDKHSVFGSMNKMADEIVADQ